MPGDWISELAETAKKHDKHHLSLENRRAKEARVIADNCQRFWDGLLAVVERDVARFQQEFAHDPKRSLTMEKTAPHCFRVFRTASSGVTLDVHLQTSDSAAIDFKYISAAGHQHAASEWSGSLAFRVGPNEELYLSQYGRDYPDLDEISRMFLERVFKGAFR